MPAREAAEFLEFVYTAPFLRTAKGVLGESDFRAVEAMLVEDPERGDPQRGVGKLRKMRYGTAGSGKRGGVRIVYFYRTTRGRIYLLLVFPKNRKASLTDQERNALAALIADIEREP